MNLALKIATGQVVSVRRPAELAKGHVKVLRENGHLHTITPRESATIFFVGIKFRGFVKIHLSVHVDVPEVHLALPVSTGKDGRVHWTPRHVVDILRVVLKRAQGNPCLALQGGCTHINEMEGVWVSLPAGLTVS